MHTLKIKKEYQKYTNKTFRLPNEIVDRLEKEANAKSTSLNKVIIQCLEFAIENLDSSNKKK